MHRVLLIGLALLLPWFAAGQVRCAPGTSEPDIKNLIAKLGDSDVEEQAVQDIVKIGRDAVPLLASAFVSGDLQTRNGAADALAKITTARDLAVPIFIQALDSQNNDLRELATKKLGDIGPVASSAVPALVSKLGDPYLRRAAPAALAHIGIVSLPAIIAALGSPDHLIRRGAVAAISGMIPDPGVEALERLGKDLAGQPVDATDQLTQITDREGLVKALIAALSDPEEDVRSGAATALGHLGNDARSIPALLALLADPDEGVRAHASNAITELGPLPCSEFVEALGDPNKHMHRSASTLLYYCKPLDKSLIPRLLKILESPDPDIMLWTSHVFEYYGSTAVPDLVGALNSPNKFARRGAARGLTLALASAPEQAIPALTNSLGDPDEFVREYALEALARYGYKSAGAVDRIKSLLTDKQPEVRDKAARALWSIGPAAIAAVPALETTLRDPTAEVRETSAEALGEIADPGAVPSLITALRDSESSVVRAAIKALGAIGSAAESALGDLAIIHRDKNVSAESESAIRAIAEALQSDLRDLTDTQLKRALDDLTKTHMSILKDGVSVDINDAITRSEAALKSELSGRSPLRRYLIGFMQGAIALVALYGIALPALILLYPCSRHAKIAVNSGFFRLPLLHRSILGTTWARQKIFAEAAKLTLREVSAVPRTYISQSVYPVQPGQASAIAFDDVSNPIAGLLAESRNAMITGRSGTGKSVLLHRICRGALELFIAGRMAALPILIDFRTTPVAGRTPQVLVKDRLKKGGVTLANAALDHLIEDGGFLILADSLNEATEQELLPLLNAFFDQDARNLVVMASQADILKRPDVAVFQIDAVTPEQARAYLRRELNVDIWPLLPEEARKLATSPQDLAVLATIVDTSRPNLVPTRRAALYRKLLEADNLLRSWLEVDNVKIRSLFGLAYQMLKREPPVMRLSEVGGLIRTQIEAQNGQAEDADVREAVDAAERSSLFTTETTAPPLNDELFTFKHEVIGKYLAAQYVLRQLIKPVAADQLASITQLGFDPRMQEVLIFVIEEADERHDMDGLLKSLMDRRRKKNRSIAESLVATALATRGGSVQAEIRNRFTDIKINQERLDTGAPESESPDDDQEAERAEDMEPEPTGGAEA